MTKDIFPTNYNPTPTTSSPESFYNPNQNLPSNTNGEFKSAEQMGEEFGAQAGNFGYGIGNAFNKLYKTIYPDAPAKTALSPYSINDWAKMNLAEKSAFVAEMEAWPKLYGDYLKSFKNEADSDPKKALEKLENSASYKAYTKSCEKYGAMALTPRYILGTKDYKFPGNHFAYNGYDTNELVSKEEKAANKHLSKLHLLLAERYYEQSQYQLCVDHAQKALEKSKDKDSYNLWPFGLEKQWLYANYNYKLGQELLKEGNLPKALKAFQTASSNNPLDLNYLLALEDAHHKANSIEEKNGDNFKNSRDEYRKNLELGAKAIEKKDHNSAVKYLEEANEHYSKLNYKDDKILKFNSANFLGEAYFRLGNDLKQEGKKEEAIVAFKNAIAQNPKFTSSGVKAIIDLDETAQLPITLAHQQIYMYTGGNPNKEFYGVTLEEEFIEIRDKDHELYRSLKNLGNKYHKQGRYDISARYFEASISPNRENPTAAHSYYILGEELNEKGDTQKALKYFEKAQEHDSGNGVYHRAIGNIHYKNGDYTKAVSSSLNLPNYVLDDSSYGAHLVGLITSLLAITFATKHLKNEEAKRQVGEKIKEMLHDFAELQASKKEGQETHGWEVNAQKWAGVFERTFATFYELDEVGKILVKLPERTVQKLVAATLITTETGKDLVAAANINDNLNIAEREKLASILDDTQDFWPKSRHFMNKENWTMGARNITSTGTTPDNKLGTILSINNLREAEKKAQSFQKV